MKVHVRLTPTLWFVCCFARGQLATARALALNTAAMLKAEAVRRAQRESNAYASAFTKAEPERLGAGSQVRELDAGATAVRCIGSE